MQEAYFILVLYAKDKNVFVKVLDSLANDHQFLRVWIG